MKHEPNSIVWYRICIKVDLALRNMIIIVILHLIRIEYKMILQWDNDV